MRTLLTYLFLEIKRTLKGVPYFLSGAIVLAVLTGVIAFSAGRILYGEQAVETIEVGVAVPEDDALAEKAMKMIASLDSVNSLCSFVYTDRDRGERMLKAGQLSALMVLPEGLVEGIVDGTNIPVTVIFSENSGLEGAVLRELTEAGASVLRTSQAGIYAADALLKEHGMELSIPEAEADLNRIFMRYALSRENYFRQERVSAAGNVTVAVFYGVSAAVFLLLLMGIPAAPLLRPSSPGLEQSLERMGINRTVQCLIRLLCLFLLLLAVSAVPLVCALHMGVVGNSPGVLVMWLLVCLASSAWIQLVFEWCRNSAAAILFLFFATVTMLFASGGIVPSVFLPETVQFIGKFTVTAVLQDAVSWMAGGKEAAPFGTVILLTGCLFVLSAAAGLKRGRE